MTTMGSTLSRGGGHRNGPYTDSLPHLCHIQRGGAGGGAWLGGGVPRTPIYMAQNDCLVVLIILSHVCWGKKKFFKFFFTLTWGSQWSGGGYRLRRGRVKFFS